MRTEIGFTKSIFLFFVILSVIFISATGKVFGQSTSVLKLNATIELPTSVPEGSIFNELNFTTRYDYSAYFNGTNSFITVEQGFLNMPLSGNVNDAIIYDNRGKIYSPIINQTTIANPLIPSIPIQSGSTYILTMSYTTETDVTLDNLTSKWLWGFAFGGDENERIISVVLPKDFSSIMTSQGANTTLGQVNTVISWDILPYQVTDCAVEFLPFSAQPRLTAMRITAQAMSNFDNTEMKMTYNESFNLRGSFLIWNITYAIPTITIPFPSNISTINVLSVSDGVNECQEQPSPLISGTYLIDYNNSRLDILPRPTYENNVSVRYDIQAVFSVLFNSSNPVGVKADIPFYMPYESAFIMVFNVSDYGFFKPDFELFEMKIAFPSGVDQIQSQTGEFMLEGSADTGFTATYDYDQPSKIPSYWILTVQQPLLRNLFFQQFDTILLFAIPLAISFILYMYQRKRKIKVIGSIGLTAFSLSDGAVTLYLTLRVIDSFTTYQSLSNLNWLYTVFLVVEVICAASVIFLFARPLIQKGCSGEGSVENETPNNEKTTKVSNETNKKNKEKVKEVTKTDNKNNSPTKQSPD